MIVEKAEKGVELEFIVGYMIPSEKKTYDGGIEYGNKAQVN